MMETKPLSPGFGLQTSDIDVSEPLSPAEFDELERTFFQGQVLVLRAQSLTPAQYVAFARRFGPSSAEVDRVTHWLTAKGFIVDSSSLGTRGCSGINSRLRNSRIKLKQNPWIVPK